MAKYLIVDDEPIIRRGVTTLISRVAPEWKLCGEAWNGAEGIDMTIQHRPDLIFADIRMPVMDGLAMSQQLINQAIPIPIVFLTGHDEFAYIQQAIKNHAFDYLLKPIRKMDVEQLFDRFEREYGFKSKLEQDDMSVLKQYEFFLLNALEGQHTKSFEKLREWYEQLQSLITLRSYIDLTVRTVNSYLLENNMISAEYKLVVNKTNTSNVIRELQEYCIKQLREAESHNTNQIIKKVKEFIDKNIAETPSLSEAADIVYLNPTYFSEYFKKYTGETFSQYIIRCKIEHAKVLLSDYSLRIYDVAFKVGYSDHRHFSKVFQSKVGRTPTEYRNKVLRIDT